MKLNEFINNTYYCSPLKIKDYNTGDIILQNVTPMNFSSELVKVWNDYEVKSYGLGTNKNSEIVFEIQIEKED